MWPLVGYARLKMGTDDQGVSVPRALPLDHDGLTVVDEQRQEAMRRALGLPLGLAAGWHGEIWAVFCGLRWCFELLSWAAHGDSAPEGRTTYRRRRLPTRRRVLSIARPPCWNA